MLEDNFNNIKKSILSYTGLPIDQVNKDLFERTDLDNFEKSILYYRFNPPIIKDGEVPGLIVEARKSRGDIVNKGFLGHSPEEQVVLYGALCSPQYKRYMIHLMTSYNSSKNVFPEDGEGVLECCLCKKNIFQHKYWWNNIVSQVPGENQEKEWLSWFSKKSSTSLCLNCISQVKYLTEMMKKIEPEFLGPFWSKTLMG